MKKLYLVGEGEGQSMVPLINKDDKLQMIKIDIKNLQIGDIIVYYNNKNFIGHRIVKIKRNQIITKGDNNPFLDKPLNLNQILGKVTAIEGTYGILDLSTFYMKFITYYFLFYSLTTYYLPVLLRILLAKILRGRKILIVLAQKLK